MEAIRFWNFKDAPECWRKLSEYGGDEDWIFEIPPKVSIPWWLDTENNGFNDIQKEQLDDGTTIIITAH